MPKLLQINVTVNFGSTGRIAEEIGQLAMSEGWISYIAYGRTFANELVTNPSRSNIIRIGTDWDVKIHGLQSLFLDKHGLASICATKKLIKQIDEIKPDIIHLHNIHGYYLNYPILFDYLATLKTPIVWTMHDCWMFTGHCSYFDMAGCERWLTECHSCPQKGEYPASILFDRSKQNYIDKRKYFTSLKNLTLVPVSDWLARLTAKSFFKGTAIHRIHNGVNIEVFKPQGADLQEKIRNKYGFGDKKILLGVASVWSERKGFDDFVKLNNLISDDMIIVLVGLTAKQIEQLPKGIIGINRTENVAELAALYSVADIFINPTYEDNFPTTNIESLACGTPVITYKTGGSVEAVDATTGLVVEQGNIKELHKAAKTIINNKSTYSSKACRERAVANYNKDDRFAEYIELYTQLHNKKQ